MKKNAKPPKLDGYGLPAADGKHPYRVMQLIEVDHQAGKRMYEDRFRWDLLSDDKAWLYAFVDLNANDHLDPNEPYAVLGDPPRAVKMRKTTRVTFRIDLSRRWKGARRW